MKKIVFFLSLFAGSFSYAEYSSIGISTQGSTSSSSTTSGVSYSHGEDRYDDKLKDDERVWGMNFDYYNTKAPTTTTDQSGNSIGVTINTNEFYVDSTWESKDKLTLGGSFALSLQSGDNVAPVMGLNPVFIIEKGFRYNEPEKKSKSTNKDEEDDSDDDIFVPSVKLKLKLGNNVISQNVGKKRPSSGGGGGGGGASGNSFSITQKLVETGLDWNFMKLMSTGLTAKKYSYSRDVNEILNLMDGGRATGPAVALSNSLSSFLDSDVSTYISFHLFNDYDLEFARGVSKAATDLSTTDDKSATLSYYGKSWSVSGTGGQSTSNSDGSTSSYWTASLKYNY